MFFKVASYNIHRCIGNDGNYNPERTRAALRQTDAEIVALQEVELLHDNPNLLEYLCEDSQWQAIEGFTMTQESGHYGNAVLTSLPIQEIRRIDISVSGREPRGALCVTMVKDSWTLKLVATHLGLRPAERRRQMEQLLILLREVPSADVVLLMGDLNEWFLWGRTIRRLRGYFAPTPAPATFPARWPLVSLDRILARPRASIQKIYTMRTRLTKMASDHLPLVAEINMS